TSLYIEGQEMNNIYWDSWTKKVFAISFGVSLFYIFPILLTSRFYIDDMGRSLLGYSGWGLNGRPLADVIMSWLSLGVPLVDLSPLTQISGVAALSLSSSLYVKRYLSNSSYPVAGLVSFLMVASPFFLENISYKYDSLTMSISLALIIGIFGFARSGVVSFLLSSVAIVASLSLYQASIGAYIILSIFEVVFNHPNNVAAVKSIANRVGQLVVGYAVYTLLIKVIGSGDEYNDEHSQIISLSTEGGSALLNNIHSIGNYFQQAIAPVSHWVIALYVLVIASFTLVMLTKSTLSNVISSVILVFAFPLGLLFSFAHIALLKEPVLSPRVLLSFSVLPLLLGMAACITIKKSAYQLALIIPMICIAFIYSYAYSNASSSQARLDMRLAQEIALDSDNGKQEYTNVAFNGRMPTADQLDLVKAKMPLIGSLVPVYMRGDWTWGGRLLHMNGLPLRVIKLGSIGDYKSTKPIAIRRDYNLYNYKGTLVVDFVK
ncbi:glucosyltransferase domain-containing protein, partial [Enterobacter hormaechei]|uniref:glucosyltransferase domain-containing protein n=2 Tax=Enterobacter hormaechei TaxID=158836 RepID=UPI001C8D9280